MASDSGTGRSSNSDDCNNPNNPRPTVENEHKHNPLSADNTNPSNNDSREPLNTYESNHQKVVEPVQQSISIPKIEVSERQINIQFERSEGLKDKLHKFIDNNNPFRRDYNGQKKKSRRTLK